MKKLLRENPVIALSIALPILIVALFATANLLPKLLVDPPAYSLLLVDDTANASISSPVNIDLSVVNDRVRVRISKRKEDEGEQFPRIYIFDHATASVRDIPIPLGEDIDQLPDGTEIVVPALANLKISTALFAPDGYEFRGYANGGAGLMTGLFGSNRSRNGASIAKDGAIVQIRLPVANDWYSDIRFLGWVVE
jgi:hypothetical protein